MNRSFSNNTMDRYYNVPEEASKQWKKFGKYRKMFEDRGKADELIRTRKTLCSIFIGRSLFEFVS